MMKRTLGMLLFIFVIIVAAACGTAAGTDKENASPAAAPAEKEVITVTHQLGETKVPKNPSKVVVFDFGALDTLDKLGVDVMAVAQASVPSYLSKYADSKYKNAGSLKEPDFEGIYKMKPDLIIISGRQSDSYEELSKIAPTIYVGVDTSKYLESFKENVVLLGKIFGKENEAKQELENMEKAVKELKDKATASGKNGLVVLVTGGKVSAYGPGSRFGIVHDEFGVKPADENIEASTHGMSVSFEYIVEKNPDYLFVVDRDNVVEGGGASAKEVIENELVKNTNAYKNGRIYYLDPNYWYLSGGGLISVSKMVEEIRQGFQ